MRSASLAGLIAIALLAACSKEPTPTAPPPPKPAFGSFGVDLAADGHERQARRRLLSLRERQVARQLQDTGRPRQLRDRSRSSSRRPRPICTRSSMSSRPASPRRAASSRRSPTCTRAGWTKPAIEARGLEPLKPYLSQHRCGQGQGRPDEAGRHRSTTRRRSACPSTPTRPIRPATRCGSARRASACRTATTTSRRARSSTPIARRISTYVTKIFELIGDKDPAGSAKRVIAHREQDRAVAWAPERQRKVSEVNNPMDLAGLKKLVPERRLGRRARRRRPRRHAEFHRERDDRHPRRRQAPRQRAARRLEGLHDLPLRRLVRDRPAEGVRRRAVRVQREDAARRRASSAIAGSAASRWSTTTIGEGLGQIYVRKHFPPETKAKMDELVANLRAALKERLAQARRGWTTPRARRR